MAKTTYFNLEIAGKTDQEYDLVIHLRTNPSRGVTRLSSKLEMTRPFHFEPSVVLLRPGAEATVKIIAAVGVGDRPKLRAASGSFVFH